VGVQKFLEGSLNFSMIPKVIERAMGRHRLIPNPTLNQILNVDETVRRELGDL